MVEETAAITESSMAPTTKKELESPSPIKPRGKWFKKIPKEILFSPGGVLLISFAVIMELIDLIPVPFLDNLWELPLELIFGAMVVVIAKIPVMGMVIPFIIERIPIINDVVPSFLLRLFI